MIEEPLDRGEVLLDGRGSEGLSILRLQSNIGTALFNERGNEERGHAVEPNAVRLSVAAEPGNGPCVGFACSAVSDRAAEEINQPVRRPWAGLPKKRRQHKPGVSQDRRESGRRLSAQRGMIGAG